MSACCAVGCDPIEWDHPQLAESHNIKVAALLYKGERIGYGVADIRFQALYVALPDGRVRRVEGMAFPDYRGPSRLFKSFLYRWIRQEAWGALRGCHMSDVFHCLWVHW